MSNFRASNGLPPTHGGESTCGAFEDVGQTQAAHVQALGLERAVLTNPDLPVAFVAESLMSLAEPREISRPFMPRGWQTDG